MSAFLEKCLLWGAVWFLVSLCLAAIWMNLSRPLPPRAPSDWERRLMRGERT